MRGGDRGLKASRLGFTESALKGLISSILGIRARGLAVLSHK